MVMDANGFLYVAGFTGSNDYEWVGVTNPPPVQGGQVSLGINDGAIIKFGCNFSIPCVGCRVSEENIDKLEKKNNDENSIHLFPNPFINETTILVSNTKIDTYTINILETNGKLLLEEKMVKCNIPYDFGKNINPGIYFIKLTIGNESKTLKLIKTN